VLPDASIDFETMDRVKLIIMKEPRVILINAPFGKELGTVQIDRG